MEKCLINSVKKKDMYLISEEHKKESISYCFKDTAFSADNAWGWPLGEVLVAFIFRNESFEIDGHT